MMQRSLAVLFTLLVGTPAFAQGTMRVVQIESKLLNKMLTVRIWTPPGYDPNGTKRYPVIYCCQNTGMPTKQIAEMITSGPYPAFILVNFEGLPYGGEHANQAVWSDIRQPSGSFFRLELIPWIDANYRTIANEQGRVLIGCSKAGGGVTHLGLMYPDMFCAFVSLDGALSLYDKQGRDLDYSKRGEGYFQLIDKHGAKVKNMPILFIEGGWFWKEGREYHAEFRKRGLADMTVIDDRDMDHNVSGMFVRRLPEIMTVFANGISGSPPIRPKLEPEGGVFVGRSVVRVTPPGEKITLFATTDGSDPAHKGTAVEKQIELTQSCLLRVVGKNADGSIATRQSIARFEMRSPRKASATPLDATKAGLRVLVVKGPLGRDKDKNLDDAEILHESRASTIGSPPPEVAAKAGGEAAIVYRGMLDVPETGVYRFTLTGNSPGLYLFDPAEKLVQMRGDRQVEIDIAFEKGRHEIAFVAAGPRALDIRVSQNRGEALPIPEAWLRHRPKS